MRVFASQLLLHQTSKQDSNLTIRYRVLDYFLQFSVGSSYNNERAVQLMRDKSDGCEHITTGEKMYTHARTSTGPTRV